jgi:hypothetical protein
MIVSASQGRRGEDGGGELPGTPPPSALFGSLAVIGGLQRSIREWAMRQGWGGRPVRVEQAQGILVAALGVLARHYGYGGR